MFLNKSTEFNQALLLTVLVMFLNKVYIAECWNWKPTTATGADFPFSL